MNRTAVALLLTIAAVAGPLVAWYVSASRELEREIETLSQRPTNEARLAATQLADQFADYLETLRQREIDRSVFHYRNLYHETRGAYTGNAVVPSPLAEGPRDPLVLAHFQIDSDGKVTMPTINTELPGLNTPNKPSEQQEILEKLKPAAMQCAVALVENNEDPLQWGRQPNAPAQGRNASGQQGGLRQSTEQLIQQEQVTQIASNSDGNQAQKQSEQNKDAQQQLAMQQRQSNSYSYQSFAEVQDALKSQKPAVPSQIKRYKQEAWVQNLEANDFYNTVRGVKSKIISSTKGKTNTAIMPMKGDVLLKVGALQWRTIPFDSKPALAALRQVTTPSGVWTQGFMVSSDAARDWMNNRKGASLPAKLAAGPSKGGTTAPVQITGAQWHVSVDPSPATTEAKAKVSTIRARFMWEFAVGASAAALAGFFVVGLVWQSDRLARNRAQFAASAAHELRTPLAGLRMYGEMLADGLGDPSQSSTYARRIADEAERLGRVVSNVLGFSRLERGRLSVRPIPGDLTTTVRDCVTRQRPRIEASGATVDLKIEDDCPNVRFDQDAVFQIVHNLIDNAEKYARGCDNRSIQVSLEKLSNGVALRVADHGPGVRGELRRRLFKPFTRGADPDAPAGLGLGLALTLALAEAQNARVHYKDGPDGGATFTVVFPTC